MKTKSHVKWLFLFLLLCGYGFDAHAAPLAPGDIPGAALQAVSVVDTDGDGMPDDWETANVLDLYYPGDADLDFDNDGRTNLQEYQDGTNPNVPDAGPSDPPEPAVDTDGDGMPDDWEMENMLDPVYGGDAAMDLDNDSLTNLQEYQAGTNPHAPDTDQDAMRDDLEVSLGLDPANPDTDGDGMPDGWEHDHGLIPEDPFDAAMDYDGDGLTNLEEWGAGANPFAADTDGDGVWDGAELEAGTDPAASDSDGDGMPDGWEAGHGLDPLDAADAALDPDDDGLTNLAESVSGTDPAEPDSDGDGLTDGDEVNIHATDPALADTDADGLSDGDEIHSHLTDANSGDTDGDGLSDGDEVLIHGTDALSGDSDGDGMPDRWEIVSGLAPLDGADASEDPDGDGFASLAEFEAGTDPLLATHYPGGPGSILWSHATERAIGAEYAIGHTAPALAPDGTVYIASTDGYLYALGGGGSLKWRYPLRYLASQTPALGADGTIYIGNTYVATTGITYGLVAINPDGTLKWEYSTGHGPVYSTPVIGGDGTIYIASNRGWQFGSTPLPTLHAVNPDGTARWSRTLGGNSDDAAAVGRNGTVYVGTKAGDLYSFSAEGELNWRKRVGEGRNLKSPAIGADGTLYVQADHGEIYAVTPAGEETLLADMGTDRMTCPVIGMNGTLFVAGRDTGMVAMAPDGARLWAHPLATSYISTAAAVGADGTLYFGLRDGRFVALNPDGSRKWQISLGDCVASSPTIGPDGTVYVGSTDGKLYAIRGDSGGLARSPWPKISRDPYNSGSVGTCGPKLATGIVDGVSNGDWVTVTLDRQYYAMVAVATPVYGDDSPPLTVRMRSAKGNSFQLRVERLDGSDDELPGIPVHYMALEAGVYTPFDAGVAMEAVRFTSTVTDRRGSWKAEERSFLNAYTRPVVLGQVMSANDPDFSIFWSRGSKNSAPPSAGALKVGKHVGEDPDRTREDETIGYLVIESGSGVLGDYRYEAAQGADRVKGFTGGNSSYTLGGSGAPSAAILSQTAMDGANGSWAVLCGPDALTPGAINLAVDEDQLRDTERNHTAEQVGYIVFE